MQHLQIILSVLFISVGLISAFYFYLEKGRSNHQFLRPLFLLVLFHLFLLVRVFVWGYLSTTIFGNYSSSELRIYTASITFLNWLIFMGMLATIYFFAYSLTKTKIKANFKYFLIGTTIILTAFELVGYIGVLLGHSIKVISSIIPFISKVPVYITVSFLFYLLYYSRKIKEIDIQKSLFSFASGYTILLTYSLLKYYIPSDNVFVLLLNSFEHISFSLFPIIWYRFYFISTVNLQNNNNPSYKLDFNSLCDQHKISEREKEVLYLLLQGKGNKEIQVTLFISASTVKNHLYSIYRKLGVKSQTKLMHKFMGINFN